MVRVAFGPCADVHHGFWSVQTGLAWGSDMPPTGLRARERPAVASVA